MTSTAAMPLRKRLIIRLFWGSTRFALANKLGHCIWNVEDIPWTASLWQVILDA